MESEQTLWEGVIRGDRKAMRMLYDCYSGYAMAICLRYLADREAARDVLQDCFVKILTSACQFEYRGEGSLKAWMTRIVVNQSLDYLTKSARFSFTDEIPDEVDDDDIEVERLPSEVLMQLIGELPEGYRTVLNLYVFEQRSHKEIARLLHIKENTSASQYLRAKKLLGEKIKDYIRKQRI